MSCEPTQRDCPLPPTEMHVPMKTTATKNHAITKVKFQVKLVGNMLRKGLFRVLGASDTFSPPSLCIFVYRQNKLNSYFQHAQMT